MTLVDALSHDRVSPWTVETVANVEENNAIEKERETGTESRSVRRRIKYEAA